MTTPTTPNRATRLFTAWMTAVLIGCGMIIVLGGANALAEFVVQQTAR